MSNEPSVHLSKRGGVKLTLTLTAAATALWAVFQAGLYVANKQRDFTEMQDTVGQVKQDTQSLTLMYAKGSIDEESLGALGSGTRLSCSCVCRPEQSGRGGGSSTVPARTPGPAMPRSSGHPMP